MAAADGSEAAAKPRADAGRLADGAAFLIALGVALGIAGALFADYHAHPDLLWRGLYHDRNGHLAAGMNFALAIRTGDPVWFFSQLLAMRVWGPVNALVLAAVFLVGGVDYRLAILPGLIGWTATVVFSWLTARRLFSDRTLGVFAAALAAIWIMASPALRLLASDVMLEGLGAGLSAAALFAYVRAREDPGDARRWRSLALVLTALFFDKANYWGLVLAAIGLAAASEAPRPLARLRAAAAWLKGRRGDAIRLVADPLLIAFLAVAGLCLWLYARGPETLSLFGQRVSLYPPQTLVTVAYALLFIRLCLWWRAHREALRRRLGTPGRAIFYWHVLPIAVSFLLPKRLASFLWYVGPADNPESGYHPLAGAQLYWDALAHGFSLAPWSALLALALALYGATQLRRLPRGARAVFALPALCALALVIHPQHQGRFLASWIFSLWICAGTGAALLLGQVTPRSRAVKAAAAAGLVAALAVVSVAAKPSPLAMGYAIRQTSGPSDLTLVRPWLPALAGARRIGVAGTFGPSELFHWPLEAQCQCKVTVESPDLPPAPTRADARQALLGAIARSRADHWVLIEAPDSPYTLPELGYGYAHLVGYVDAMRAQTRFVPVGVYALPDGARATVYRRAGG